jgi:hypothetical protein
MEAVVFSGVQGVGKSTFYRERFFATHVRINLDMLRTRNREDVLLQFMEVVERAGTSFAFPTRTVHITGTSPFTN